MSKNSIKSHSCIVLSGGLSRRMGKDKGSMIIQDKPMIFHILEKLNNKINDAVIVLNSSERVSIYEDLLNQYSKDNIYNEFNYKISFVVDEIENKGPLCGIMTGLKHINTDYALILPCDSPYMEDNYIDKMFKLLEENKFPDALIPFNNHINHEKDILNNLNKSNNLNNQINDNPVQNNKNITIEDKIKQSEPLHSIYSKNTLFLIEDLLKNDDLFVKSFINKIENKSFILIDDKTIKKINFKNINRIEDIDM